MTPARTEPALPPRSKELVPIVTEGPLAAACLGWQLVPPQESLVVVVKQLFALALGAPVVALDAAEPLSGDVPLHEEGPASLAYASDLAPFKPKADVTLTGHAHTRSGQCEATTVTLGFGSSRWSLAAIGDRRWEGEAMSTPAQFERMPLTWERAFGGLGKANPVGRGAAGVLLPNLEDAHRLITETSDAPAPVCFAPVPREWPARSGRLGSYDAAWLRDRWPYFPADFDWSYFNAAPARQQIDYPRGDERFELCGVHPKHAVVTGQLAGTRARAFALRTTGLGDAMGGAFQEISMRLDTVAFDADAMRVHLVWRGHLDVSAEHAPELDRLFVMSDPLAAPCSLEEARARFTRQATKLHGERPVASPLATMSAPSDGGPASRSGAAARAIGPDPSATRHAPRTHERRARKAKSAALPTAPAALSRDAALLVIGAGAPLEGFDFTGCDLREVDLRGRKLCGIRLVDAVVHGARFDGADLTGAQLARARAVGASFVGANLTSANLAEAILEAADFGHATLDFATLADVDAASAVFCDASLAHTNGAEGVFDDARFDRAVATGLVLAGASLERASFRGAKLDDAQLYDTEAAGACFDGASMLRVRADDAVLAGARFTGTDASDSSFAAADLSRCHFEGAKLDDSVFAHAVLAHAVLSRASAKSARFRHADLRGASALKANFMEASFESANLTGADLRGANLYGAETRKATLAGARLEQALTLGSKLATH